MGRRTVEDIIREPPPFPWRALVIGGLLVALIGVLGFYVSVLANRVRLESPNLTWYYGIITLGLLMVVLSVIVALLKHLRRAAKIR